jgi:hypothetical protein
MCPSDPPQKCTGTLWDLSCPRPITARYIRETSLSDTEFKLSVGGTRSSDLLETEGLASSVSEGRVPLISSKLMVYLLRIATRSDCRYVGLWDFRLDSADWSNGIRYHAFGTRSDTESKVAVIKGFNCHFFVTCSPLYISHSARLGDGNGKGMAADSRDARTVPSADIALQTLEVVWLPYRRPGTVEPTQSSRFQARDCAILRKLHPSRENNR